MYRRVDDSGQQIAISPVEGRVLVSIAEAEGIPYNRGSWWATREDAQAILDAHDQLDAHNRIPDEPEPGPYLIGGVLCWRDTMHTDGQPDDDRWRVRHHRIGGWWTWPSVWRELGGPDVRIVALVPRPEPVELPWEGGSGGTKVIVDVSGGISLTCVILDGNRGKSLTFPLGFSATRAMAAALWTAADRAESHD